MRNVFFSDRLHKLDFYQNFVEIIKQYPILKKSQNYGALLSWNIDLVKVTTKY